ncbi:hypothetical protein [Pseudogemmobacter bohemicus]|uniref:hypothetical protein n=1 Tax=Pseudogemmobacter bohemicus TaxID=2250708 RepID=UPI000DD47596|nr:hypothetical protein [Pseudogemmobacter bohemicus]
MSEFTIEHDRWNTSLAKLPKAPPIKLGDIYGVLPFDGVRNPSSRSSVSHKVFMTYKTEANDWKPKVGMMESAAEAAVGLQALISPELYDLSFQPETVRYIDEDGARRSYTHDILLTFRNGFRRLVFVRNETSLAKPKTKRQIEAVAKVTPGRSADDMVVVNARDYSRQRRENLFRMHLTVFNPDPEADEITLEVARRLKTLYLMKDLFPRVPIKQHRVFSACYRLVARGEMLANLDHLLWEHSRIEVAK